MAEKSRILYIITKSVWGGAQKYVFDLASNLPKDKFEAVVAAGGHGVMAGKLETKNVPYFEIKSFQRDVSFLKDFFAFFEILSLLFKTKPDVVHVSSAKAGGVSGIAILFYRLFSSWLQATSYKLQAVFTVHGWAFNEPRPSWQNLLIKIFSKITCLFYDKIICVSQHDYDCAIKNKIAPARKLVMIHNGIKEEDYNFLTREDARKTLIQKAPSNLPLKGAATPSPLGEGRGEASLPDKGELKGVSSGLWLGTIGEFTKNKGQRYLIDALQKLQTISYKLQAILIGHGELKEELQKQINAAGLESSVFVIDNLPDASNYLKAFDIFVLPSIKEGLPYVLLEAGLAGIPTVATDVGGIKEILAPSIPLKGKVEPPLLRERAGVRLSGILIPPANPTAFIEAIKKLTDNSDLRQTLVQNTREKILKDFSFEKMLRETIKIYSN